MHFRFGYLSILALLAIAFCAPRYLKADTLTGSTVNGTITTQGISLITQFTSPQVISSDVEFTGAVSNGPIFNISADFSEDLLTIAITSPVQYSNLQSRYDLFNLIFSDPAFDGPFTLLSYGCASGVNACSRYGSHGLGSGLYSNTFSGSTLTLNFNDVAEGQIYTFAQPTAMTPEPSSVILLGTGLLGAIGVARKKYLNA